MAHAAMLSKQGIIPADDAALIIKTPKKSRDIEAGKVTFTDEKAEDIRRRGNYPRNTSAISANACIPAQP